MCEGICLASFLSFGATFSQVSYDQAKTVQFKYTPGSFGESSSFQNTKHMKQDRK